MRQSVLLVLLALPLASADSCSMVINNSSFDLTSLGSKYATHGYRVDFSVEYVYYINPCRAIKEPIAACKGLSSGCNAFQASAVDCRCLGTVSQQTITAENGNLKLSYGGGDDGRDIDFLMNCSSVAEIPTVGEVATKKYSVSWSHPSACAIGSNPDEITSLPGWGDDPLPSRLFSGYLNVTHTKNIHYVFAESENNPAKDPVVLWLNGGPGCSSLDGFWYENGPYVISKSGHDLKLTLRGSRWTKFASVLYLEAPVGVGYSYSTRPTVDYKCDDDTTARDNLEALQIFFARFPQFRKNDFFITGESYAGIYVPTLAEAVHNATVRGYYKGAPLKGIGVGNGCSGSTIGICGNGPQGTYYEFKYLLGLAFISDTLKTRINDACDWEAAKQHKPLSKACTNNLTLAGNQIGHINIYDVYGDCISAGDGSANTLAKHSKAPRNFESILKGPEECIDSVLASMYMNSDDAIEAFHLHKLNFTWGVCQSADGWSYNSTRPNLPRDTYPTLVKNYRVLIFNGDWDACVPYTDNEAWTTSMGYDEEEPWHAWTYTTAEGLDNQVGGYAVKYKVPDAEDDAWFRFITIRGGRHEVPESAPTKATEMVKRLLQDGDY